VPRKETTAERWERARLLFEARDYVGAAKPLTTVVGEVPEQTGPLLLAAPTTTRPNWAAGRRGLRDLIDLHPVEHYGHLLLSRTLQRQGRHDEAESWPRIAAAFTGELPATDWAGGQAPPRLAPAAPTASPQLSRTGC
jgi:hypothetical protein